ncbi:MAG: hypothetical protein U0768_11725 [Anaerolineae bacterium]
MSSQDPWRPRRLLSTPRSVRRIVLAAALPALLVLAVGVMGFRVAAGDFAATLARPAAQPGLVAGAIEAPAAPPASPPEAMAAVPPQFPGVGLGRGRGEWERERGNSGVSQGAWTTYQNGRYWVQFKNNNIWHLDVHLSDTEALPLPNARAAISALLPPDAKRIKTYSPAEDVVVDVYQSDWLARQYGNVVWPRGARAGTLIIRNRIKDELPGGNRVVWLGIEAGNDPAQNNP